MVGGFRAFSDGFSYVLLNGTQENPAVVAHERLTFPKGQSGAPALCWVRKQVAEILQHHQIEAACIKGIEPISKTKSSVRIQVEAIILEALFTVGHVQPRMRIKSQLKKAIPGFSEPARYLEHVLTELSFLEELNLPNFTEATLAAVSMLPPR